MSFLNPLFEAVAWVMMRIHAVLAVPFGAASGLTWALTIIILVVLMRLVMVPLFIKQRNSMQKMQSHMPALQDIRKRYKNDKTRLNEETMKFYKENGINPLGGCLPLVAQLPVFWSLFNVLRAVAEWQTGAPKYGMTVQFVESAHNARIFGIALVDQFLHPVKGELSSSRYLIVVFVLVSAATTFLTMRQSQKRNMMNPTTPDPDQPGAAAAQAMSKNMMYIAPFFALTGLYWQFGLVLYWVTTNVWTLGQQHFLFRNLPVVGSATVDASAVGAVSGNGSAAKASAPRGAAARAAATAPPKAAARPAAGRPAAGVKAAPAKAAVPAKATTPAKAATPAAKANGTAPAAKANGTRPAAGGPGALRRLGRSKQEQPEAPAAPETRVVRQQPVRQTRSRRGNSGKR